MSLRSAKVNLHILFKFRLVNADSLNNECFIWQVCRWKTGRIGSTFFELCDVFHERGLYVAMVENVV